MNDLSFKLIKINTEQFAIIEDNYNADDTNINIGLEAKLGVDMDNATLKISLKFKVNQSNYPFIIIEVSCEFEISELSMIQKENKLIIPKEKVINLMEFVTNTARGVLHAKTENSNFNQYVIPKIDIEEFVSEEAIFELN